MGRPWIAACRARSIAGCRSGWCNRVVPRRSGHWWGRAVFRAIPFSDRPPMPFALLRRYPPASNRTETDPRPFPDWKPGRWSIARSQGRTWVSRWVAVHKVPLGLPKIDPAPQPLRQPVQQWRLYRWLRPVEKCGSQCGPRLDSLRADGPWPRRITRCEDPGSRCIRSP